jgi:subtilisin family serine protease
VSAALRLATAALFAALLSACSATPVDEARLARMADYSRYVIVTVRNGAALAPPRAGASVRNYAGAPRYTVSPSTRSTARAIAEAYGLREADAWPIDLLGVHCVVFELPAGAAADDVMTRLRRDRRVESVQPLQSFGALSRDADEAPDPYRKLQRNLDVMQVGAAHRWSRGEGVSVGVIDTGVDASHPDLAGRIVRQEDLVGDRVAAERHGTAVAGLIGAAGNNRHGIIGVAPAARLYALRACWPRPDDEARAACSSFTLAKALVAAIEARLQVVNLSLGGPADPLLTRIVEAGLKRGIVFVGATPPAHPLESFPTNIHGVIAANASGAAVEADATVFAPVLAPAREVLTLAPGGRYDFMSGSSLAAASVTGGVALLLARQPGLGAEGARRLLVRSMREVALTTGETLVSVDVCAAVSTLVAPTAECRE